MKFRTGKHSISSVEEMFYSETAKELSRRGVSAIGFLRAHPKKSKKEIAMLLGNGVTVRGLTIAIFKEARECNLISEIARELLYRKIAGEFPRGWETSDEIHAAVKIGGWYSDIAEFAPEYEHAAEAIVKALAHESVPDLGWLPSSPDDDRLIAEFESKWRGTDG